MHRMQLLPAPCTLLDQGQTKPRVPPYLAYQIVAANQSALTSTEANVKKTHVLGGTNALQSDTKETTPTPSVLRSICLHEKPSKGKQGGQYPLANTLHVDTVTMELQHYIDKTLMLNNQWS